MKRGLIIFWNVAIALLSLAIFAGSGWLWHRSVHVADHFYRPEPDVHGQTVRGFGSCKGVCLYGTVNDSLKREPSSTYLHDVYPVSSGGGKGPPSVLAIRPAYVAGGLGFGVSHGELALNLPLASLLPKRTYHVVFVPYYFIMLLALIPPALIARDFRRRGQVTSDRSNQALACQS